MRRLTSALLAVLGALLVVSWVVASGTPPQPSGPAVAAPNPPPAPPELDVINREIARLGARLEAPASDVTPIRDPFQFASAATPSSLTSAVPPPDAPGLVMPATPPELRVRWPRLVAIVSDGDEAAPTLRAVFEDARQIVQLRSAGETLDEVTVDHVAPGTVTLTHAPTGTTRHVPLD